jgi:hypothetical protein
METLYMILLLPVELGPVDKAAVESSQAATFKCTQPIEWTSLPQETRAGIAYHRLVVSQTHLVNNLKVASTALAADKFAAIEVKGCIVLRGDDWRAALDKAGFSPVAEKPIDPKPDEEVKPK